MRDDRQQLVARAVAERVVDALEVIEVHVHERAAREPGGRGRELLREPVAEQRAIRQLRERIVVRLAIEPFVARAVRQRRAQPLGESRAVVGDRRIARRFAVISDDQHGGQAVFVDHRPEPEEFGAGVAHRREECVARFFDARDGHAFGRLAHRGDHRGIEGHALHGQFVGAERRHEQAAVRVRGRIQQDDAHALAARQLAEFRQHDVERAIDLAGGEQRAVDFAEHFECAPVALQRQRGDVELALERREFLDGAARQRFEAALAQARESALQRAQRRQISFADDRGDREGDHDGERQQAERRRHQLRRPSSRRSLRARTRRRCWRSSGSPGVLGGT